MAGSNGVEGRTPPSEASGGRTPRPRRIGRALGLGALFALGAVLGMAAAAPDLVARTGLRARAALEERLDVRIAVDRVDWSWDGRVTLAGLRVRPRGAPAKEDPLVAVDELRLRTRALWTRGRIRPTRVEAEGVDVNLRLRGDGRTNVDELLRAVRERLGGDGPAGDPGAGGGGLEAWIDRAVPTVRLADLAIDARAAPDAPLPEGVPRRMHLAQGRLEARNTALLAENDHLRFDLHFGRASVVSSGGLRVQGTLPLRGGEPSGRVELEEPARVRLGDRVVAIAGAGWKKGTLTLDRPALSVPVGGGDDGRAGGTGSPSASGSRREEAPAGSDAAEPLEPALTAERVELTWRLGTLLRLLAEGQSSAEGADRAEVRSWPHALASALKDALVVRPAVVFHRREDGGGLAGLLPGGRSGPAAPARSGVAPEELDRAARAAIAKLAPAMREKEPVDSPMRVSEDDEPGHAFQRFVIGTTTRLERRLDALSARLVAAAERMPMETLRVRDGHFAWRDERASADAGARAAGRLRHFDLEVHRKRHEEAGDAAGVLRFETSFHAPGTTGDANRLEGRVDTGSGDLELRAVLDELQLRPYRHAFPEALPVGASTRLRDTDLSLLYAPNDGIGRLEGRVELADLRVRHDAVAERTLGDIDLGLELEAQLDTRQRKLTLAPSELRLGSARARISGDVRNYDTVPQLSGALRLQRMRCQELLASLPDGLLPALRGARVEGTMSWQLDFSVDTGHMESLTYHAWPEINHFRIVELPRVNLEAVRGTFVHTWKDEDGETHRMLVGPESPGWTPLEDVASCMPKTLTTTEDGTFWEHDGFADFAIRDSLIANLKAGRFVRGASTMSQQLVKNLFLSSRKTLSRKLQEMLITWRLERMLDKERILELYLNVIEWGPELRGIREAAWHYFSKAPSELKPLECAFLASLIPNPDGYYEHFEHALEEGGVPEHWRKRLRFFLREMVERDKIDEEVLDAAKPFQPTFERTPAEEIPRPKPGDLDAERSLPAPKSSRAPR